MVSAPPLDLLGAARSFIRRSAGTAALVIAPLAAVQLASTAHAQAIFQLPGSANDVFRSGSSFVTVAGPSGFAAATLPLAANGSTGALVIASIAYTLAAASGGSWINRSLTFTNTGGGTLPTGNLPVAYSFTFGTSGTITNLYWALYLRTDAAADSQTIASSSNVSAGTISGTGNYSVVTGAAFTSYTVDLLTSYYSTVGDTLTITMNQGAGQGIALNATAIPEPSTYAGLLGLGVGLLALFRRSARRIFG